MAQSAASKAEQAADALDRFLRDRPEAVSADPPQAVVPVEARDEAPGDDGLPPRRRAKQAGPAAIAASAAEAPLRLPHTDWLFHRLSMTGPAATVAAFRGAASGAGTAPWQLDGDGLEEDWFHLLVNPADRALSLAGARVLASQLRAAVERRHALAVANWPTLRFDLQSHHDAG